MWSLFQPSRKRSSVVNSIADREEPPLQPPTGGGSGSDGVEDEGLGSETKIDRPSSARGSRRLSSHPSVADHIPETLPPSGPPTNGRKGEDVANRSPSPPAQPPQGLVCYALHPPPPPPHTHAHITSHPLPTHPPLPHPLPSPSPLTLPSPLVLSY